MIELLLAVAFNCSEADGLIESVNKSRVEEKEDIITVIKLNTEPGCYEGSERNL